MRIRQDDLNRLIIFVPIGIVLCLLLTAGLYFLGRGITPFDSQHHPLVLSPNLMAVRQYQIKAATWPGQIRDADSVLVSVIDQNRSDPYAASQAISDQIIRLDNLVKEISAIAPPPVMDGLYSIALTTAQTYRQAAERAAELLSGPSAERQKAAVDSIRIARNYLQLFEGNQWLTNQY